MQCCLCCPYCLHPLHLFFHSHKQLHFLQSSTFVFLCLIHLQNCLNFLSNLSFVTTLFLQVCKFLLFYLFIESGLPLFASFNLQGKPLFAPFPCSCVCFFVFHSVLFHGFSLSFLFWCFFVCFDNQHRPILLSSFIYLLTNPHTAHSPTVSLYISTPHTDMLITPSIIPFTNLHVHPPIVSMYFNDPHL